VIVCLCMCTFMRTDTVMDFSVAFLQPPSLDLCSIIAVRESTFYPLPFQQRSTSISLSFTHFMLAGTRKVRVKRLSTRNPPHPSCPSPKTKTHPPTHPPTHTNTKHTHPHTHTPTHPHTYLHTHTPTHPPTHTHTHPPTHTYLHTHTPTHPHPPTHPPTHTHTLTYTCYRSGCGLMVQEAVQGGMHRRHHE